MNDVVLISLKRIMKIEQSIMKLGNEYLIQDRIGASLDLSYMTQVLSGFALITQTPPTRLQKRRALLLEICRRTPFIGAHTVIKLEEVIGVREKRRKQPRPHITNRHTLVV